MREEQEEGLLLLSSGSSATSVTGHLDLANDNAGVGDEFKTFEAEFADLDGLTEFEVGNVDIQTLGDSCVNSLHLQFADAGSQLTTGLHTNSETVELDGHFHDDGLLVGDLVEIYVQDIVLDGVELSLLEDSEALLAVDVELNSIDVGGVDELAELAFGDAESESFGQTVLALLLTIEVAGDDALLTQLLGQLLAASGTCSTFDLDCFHFLQKFVLL